MSNDLFFYLNIFYGLGFWPEHTYDSILAVRDKIQIVSSAAAGQNNLPTISLPICDHLRQLVAIFSHSFHHWIFFFFVPTSFSRGGSICQQNETDPFCFPQRKVYALKRCVKTPNRESTPTAWLISTEGRRTVAVQRQKERAKQLRPSWM